MLLFSQPFSEKQLKMQVPLRCYEVSGRIFHASSMNLIVHYQGRLSMPSW